MTSTFYGQWLPEIPADSVTNVRDRRPSDPLFASGSNTLFLAKTTRPTFQSCTSHQSENSRDRPLLSISHKQSRSSTSFRKQPLTGTGCSTRFQSWSITPISSWKHRRESARKNFLPDFKVMPPRRMTRLFGSRESKTWWTTGRYAGGFIIWPPPSLLLATVSPIRWSLGLRKSEPNSALGISSR